MTTYVYYTATTLDGFLADDNDSLDWLMSQPIDDDGPMNIPEFMAGIGSIVMGYSTYRWVVDHLERSGDPWMYAQHQSFVFTHQAVEPVHDSITVVSGSPSEHRFALESAAGEKSVWVVGGGNLAAQFASDAMLDELILSYAPVTLGSGKPLFTAAFDFELVEWFRNEAFLIGRYRVTGQRR